jgi:20S proteasome subunit beta 6
MLDFFHFQAGLDQDGKGVIFGYDPVGCVETLTHCAGGAGVTLMQPLLDNQVDKKNQHNVDNTPLTLDEAERLVHDCFISAAEREIHVGDAICMRIITKDGIQEKVMALRRD